MSFSPLADLSHRIPDGGRSVPRQSAITGFGIHHNAGVDSYGEATNPRREVSANYWIANDGTILPNIDEERRAFTSGAANFPAGALADHRNITVEVSNSPEGLRDGTWAISDAAMSSLIALIADVYRRHSLGPVVRGNGSYLYPGNGLGVHQDWVNTSCPGPYIMDNLGGIIAAAETQRAGGATTPPEQRDEDDIMAVYLRASGNSSPLDATNPGTSRIWAGDGRVINGATYSGVWERSEDGTVRRLFPDEWAAIQRAYAAAGKKVPYSEISGNELEKMYLVERAAPKR